MTRALDAVTALVLLGLAACGDATPTSDPRSQSPNASEVGGPSEFFFIVDGPLVTNGPPWNCVSAQTECDAPEGNFAGTIELLDDCIVVQGSDSAPGSKTVVIFDYGVTWDEATSTILGLGPEPVAIGDYADLLANDGGSPDDWTETNGIADVPDKLRECMRKAGAESVRFNTPWKQVGVAPPDIVSPDTSPPPGP
jgi:hypothetical protein